MASLPNVPVLIAGAGPTGLTLALTLRRWGIPVRLIDRAPAPATVSKALAVWSASLEALASLGVVDAFEADGTRLRSLTVGDGEKVLSRLVVGEGIDSPYPYPLLLPQSRTEAILGARAEAEGIAVERGVELVGLAQDEAGVTARLRHADGREEDARALYLVGADGARSFVRNTLGIAFEGYTEPQTFLLGDVGITGTDLDRASIYIWWHNGSTVALFPFGDDVWRIFAVRNGEGDAPPTLEELQDQMDRHGPPGARLHDPSWLSAFRTNERLAAHYRSGRVFLAGDAAHIHSPAGGQGMNTGIQDAVNLGWKLAYALRGLGDGDLLLDSYEAERRPVARDVVAGAAQKLHVAFADGKMQRLLRNIAVSMIGRIPAAQKMLQVELSETGIAYHDGPLVALGVPPRHPKRTDAGTRARDATFRDEGGGDATLWPLLAGPHHTLILFEDDDRPIALDADITAFVGPDLFLVRIPAAGDPGGKARERYHLRGPGWVLVRPDQVVAARGGADTLSLLANYLGRVLRKNV